MIEQEVVSSQIKKVGYDEEKKELFVTFNTGKKYKYSNVPMALFLVLMSSESIGRCFGEKIKNKPDEHPYELIES